MNINTAIRRFASIGLSTALSVGIFSSAYAAPGTLATSPLFLSNYPQPNIFFMLDDSGSMDWEGMVDNSVYAGSFGLPTMFGWSRNYYVLPAANNNYDKRYFTAWGSTCTFGVRIGCFPYVTPSDNAVPNNTWRMRNHNFNTLYYNPAVTYEPWGGVDSGGSPLYSDVSPTAAPVDPGDPSQGTMNLTQNVTYVNYNPSTSGTFQDIIYPAHYFTWTDDSPNNGRVDGADTHSQVLITSSVATYTGSADRTDCVNAPTCTYAEEIQNFANWFSYHRRREYVSKYAVSKLVASSQNRVGMSVINNDYNQDYFGNTAPKPDVGFTVADVDDISTPIDTSARTNKVNLLAELAKVDAWGGTPLRVGLRNVGNYYEGVSTGVSSLFGSTQPSPILSAGDGGTCQQNFTILMSDGFWNGGTSPSVGNTDQDGAGIFDGASYADTRSDTLADVAMRYYERDLATTFDDEVPVTTIDVEAINNGQDEMHQHMVTYTVAFGLSGNASCDPSSRTSSVVSQNWPEVCTNPGATSGTGWPNPIDNEDLDRVDDMRHAAWNGRGSFLSASNPQALVAAMTAAIEDIGSRTGTVAPVSFNSTSLQTDTLVYRASFDSAGWSGDLEAIKLEVAASGAVSLGATQWSAATELDSRNLTTSPREVVTYNGTQGVAFAWPADYQSPTSTELSSAQINDLLANAPYAVATVDAAEIAANKTYGENIIDYLMGDDSNEGSGSDDFRERNGHRLGDIVHSAPYYVGVPSAPYLDQIEGSSHKYSDFVASQASRDARIYVGANDGMLHAFDAGNGKEKFAYMPGFLFSDDSGEGLHHLAEQAYVHDYYVDLSAKVADVFIGSAWKTYLIGGVRGGGKGIFVLDVTNPGSLTAANAASIVKMEYTHADLGYTFSDIQVGKMNNGKWAAIFGNGYNNTGDGTAKLFILYLDGSTPDIIETKVGSISGGDCTDAASDCNGLSTPALADINGDGKIDRIYAGDLKGNMWAFDVSASAYAGTLGPVYGSVAAPQPLFIACEDAGACSTSNRQPITSKPTLAWHATQRSVSTYPNIMVYFGTGQYLTAADNSTTQQQELYGVWDRGTAGVTSDDLVRQTITETTTMVGMTAVKVRIMSDNAVSYTTAASSDYGWRIELPTSMERNVVDATTIGDITMFSTLIPETGACTQGASGWYMYVDRNTGGMPDFVVLDINNDGVFDGSDMAGAAFISGTHSDGGTVKRVYIGKGGNEYIGVGGSEATNIQGSGVNANGRQSWTSLEN